MYSANLTDFLLNTNIGTRMHSEIADATSKFQDSLPVSSDHLMKLLGKLDIPYQRFDHVALRTVEDSKKVQSQFNSDSGGGGHIKNLYLRDNKKRNILFVAEQDRKIDLKDLPTLLGTGRLSFGSAERLFETLGVRPGAVTPLAMINGVNAGVSLFLDNDLKKFRSLYVHPLVNDRTLEIDLVDLEKLFQHIGVELNWVNLT